MKVMSWFEIGCAVLASALIVGAIAFFANREHQSDMQELTDAMAFAAQAKARQRPTIDCGTTVDEYELMWCSLVATKQLYRDAFPYDAPAPPAAPCYQSGPGQYMCREVTEPPTTIIIGGHEFNLKDCTDPFSGRIACFAL